MSIFYKKNLMDGFKMKVMIIIDAYSTGKYLPSIFEKQGIYCIHVQTQLSYKKFVPTVKNARNGVFLDNFVFDNDLKKLVLSIQKKYEIINIIPGSESGVELADEITDFLGIEKRNPIKYSKARRNKFLMAEAVKNTPVLIPQFLHTNDLKAVMEWSEKFKNKVVLKPVKSASSDHVFICSNSNEIIFAFQKILKALTIFGEINNMVLVQEYVDGDNYIVNTVSNRGIFCVTSLWRVNMVSNTVIIDTCEALDSEASCYNDLVKATKHILSKLEIYFGAATIEFKWLKGKLPVFIEVGARLMGGENLTSGRRVYGCTQAEVLVESYVDESKFQRRSTQKMIASEYCKAKLLQSPISGLIKYPFILESRLNNFKTLCDFEMFTRGQKLCITLDEATSPGVFYFVSKSKDSINEDINLIRMCEQKGMYYYAVLGGYPRFRLSSLSFYELNYKSSSKNQQNWQKEEELEQSSKFSRSLTV
jgi:biotin carboxylase